MNSPEAYIQWKPGLVDADGNVTVQSTQDFLRTWMRELHAFIARVYMVLPRGA
jgi:chromate reductase